MPVSPVAGAAAAPAPAAPQPSFGAALRARSAPPTASPAPARDWAPARAALASVERARERLDAIVAAARRGRTFTPQELLALQADAYRYSQTLDVASRLVEHAAQCLKQAVNTQV